jgi:GDP-4-dehydro-6-deoxy-D-mannose reductase
MSRAVLVTGAAGFAGGHLVDSLVADGMSVVAWHRPGGTPPERPSVHWMPIDVLERSAVARGLEKAAPDLIFHCAGSAHVGSSWRDSAGPLEANALGTHHLLAGMRQAGLRCRVVVTGSAAIYRPASEPLAEESPVGPSSPYGLSKLAQEMAALRAADVDGLPVIATRSFNHAGPRQSPSYATASFARQIALAEAGRAPRLLTVGNLDARRDLTDVRDTVRAYRKLAELGTPGQPYNVCRGCAYSMRELLDGLLAHARMPLEVRTDPSLLRPNDNPVILGDPSRIRRETGWQADIPMERTLADLLDYWRERVAAGERAE